MFRMYITMQNFPRKRKKNKNKNKNKEQLLTHTICKGAVFMFGLIMFLVGLVFGGTLGVAAMCMLQINRIYKEK